MFAEKLATFIPLIAARKFEWAQCDCSLFLADWIQHCTGIDHAAHLRGTYASAEECAVIVRVHGTLVKLVHGLVKDVARRVNYFCPGDFGVVRFDGKLWGALMGLSGRWIIKPHDGIVSLPADHARCIAAWRLN